MALRRLLAIGCFTAMVLLSIDAERILRPLVNRGSLRMEAFVRADGPWWPDYPAFLEKVRERTKNGDTIALVFPRQRWSDGYSWAFFRASYLLAGREVLPVIDERNVPQPQNIERAQYIAIFDASRRGRLVRR